MVRLNLVTSTSAYIDTAPLKLGDSFTVNSQSRIFLMKKLAARTQDLLAPTTTQVKKDDSSSPILPTSRQVVLKHVYDAEKEEREYGPGWEQDLEGEVAIECQRFGKILHLAIDEKDKALGAVYMKYDNTEASTKCLETMNNRFFGGQRVRCHSVPTSAIDTNFPLFSSVHV